MGGNDRPVLGDIAAALRLLTRLPLPHDAVHSRAAGAWAWPLAGIVVTALAVGVGMVTLPLGAGVAAALTLGTHAMLTGAMHEDGLADSADGLWGGWDKARRLAIMKDSHIGTYGVMALLVVGLIRWSALASLLADGGWAAIIGVGALSRVPMVLVMATLPNARGTGLAQSVGRPSGGVAGAAAVIGLGLGMALCGWAGLAAAGAIAATTALMIVLAWAKIGGQTGDILGASQQLAEAAALSVVAALMV